MKSLSRVDTVTYCLFCKMPYEEAQIDRFGERVFCRTCIERALNKAGAEMRERGYGSMSEQAYLAIKIYDERRAKNGNR